MKKLYFFLVALLTLISAQSLSAGTATFVVDNPAAVKFITVTYPAPDYQRTETNLVETVAAVNQIDVDGSLSMYVNANDGYAITSIKLNDSESGTDYVYSRTTSQSLYVNGSDNPTYYVKTLDLNAARTAAVNVTVDDPDKVSLYRNGDTSTKVSLVAGTQQIKFIPGEETPFMIRPVGSALYAVTLNGVAQTANYGSYSVSVADGDTLNIQANYPDVKYTVKVEVPEGLEGVFTNVTSYDRTTYTTTALEGDFFTGVGVQAGTEITVNLNTSSYAIEAIYANGVKQSNTYSYSGVVSEDLTVKIEAHAYATYTVEMNVDDPARVAVYSGYSAYGTKYDLVAGKNELTFTEQQYGSNYIYIAATDGNIITGITKTNGETVTDLGTGNNSYAVVAGDKFTVTSKVAETYVVKINVDDATRVAVYNGYNSYYPKYDIVSGVNELTFSEASTNNIYIAATAGNMISKITRTNGETVTEAVGDNAYTLAKGDEFTIVSKEKEMDASLIVWLDPNVTNVTAVNVRNNNTSTLVGAVSVSAGVNELKYCSADSPNFLYVDMNASGQVYLVFNDNTALQQSYLYPTFTGNDILRIFKEEPVKAVVTWSLSDGVSANDFTVKADGMAVENFTTTNLYVGSGVVVTPQAGKTLAVSVDGTAVTANADGAYEVAVKGNATIAVSSVTSGINAIDADNLAGKVVYNLQGVKIANTENLPVGIYIINGKKVLVK
jgi:hypothetical protein